MASTQQRDSNIEMLRIIAMLMIIANHLSAHGIMDVLTEAESYFFWNTGSLTNKLFSSMLRPGGEVGVGLFLSFQGIFVYVKMGNTGCLG